VEVEHSMVAAAGAGNNAESWQRWGGLDELRPACWGPPGRVVVVTAHRGDEVLGLGGTLQTLVAAGHSVELVRLGCDRETGTGPLGALGVDVVSDTTLPRADTDCDEAVVALAKHLVGASWCVTPWRHDGDPAHDRAGAVAAEAAASVGVPLTEYLVRTWDWASPGDERVPWSDARRSAFDHRVLARKQVALAGATGETAAEVSASLLRSFEVVLQPAAGDPMAHSDNRIAS
jgi:LmbE family N-acetylglucosaminyl deacetylase